MKYSKYFSATLVAAFLLVSQVAFAAFKDVPASSPSYDAVNYLQNNLIVNGYIDGTYRPDATIIRADFLKILIGSTKTPVELDNCVSTMLHRPFVDVNWDQYYGKYLCNAYRNGIIVGYKDNTFRPTVDISFAEAAKIIVKAYGYDASDDPTWYKPYIMALSNKNAVPGTIQNQDAKLTRAEMAEMIYRLTTKNSSKFSLTYDQVAGTDRACVKVGGFAGGYTLPQYQTHCCAGLIQYDSNQVADMPGVCLEPQPGLAQAVQIMETQNECTTNPKLGIDLSTVPFKNQNFNGYSFALKSYQNGCAARCDVNLDSNKATVGWMCTGVIPQMQ